MKYPFITLLGPTATGKTKFAALLADTIGAEIISADSRQVYKGMDIGSGKDIKDYTINDKVIPYHLIDIAEAGTEFNVFQYQQAAYQAIENIRKRNKNIILCGGSGMYIEALLKGYKLFPVPTNDSLREQLSEKSFEELTALLAQFRPLHNQTDTEDISRLLRALEIEYYYSEHPELLSRTQPIKSIIFGLKGDRDLIRNRITARLKERLENGMIEEVQKLVNEGVSQMQLVRYGLEYKYITLYLQNKIDKETLFSKLNIAIHQFSKRQMTWFRKMERSGFVIHWLDILWSNEKKLQFCLEKLL
ncbi:MAG TPA: tRNA (adenosine(37)-N6)-dimethylallyltransferase MiaA [Bacteroidales bacterium]|nr:tRNA (adenosine(37)-N6)-dimethylallyltransferase MiaA [Bacteroidales bacterium]HOS57618.1 tRNA (adenosine(37)-N6)-dimethylallyltransferase MiaA [Bacteroidales bacterium]HRR04447.1 tRNA (adenosine(37)-N6)-dimethylallyltransferase MiaA [Bacteroidales bacterium]HRT13350.1 tRNA (adenosine(37)-N6)-dimethylallyltransferase MiaA [Bacteroidales bacterium]HXK73299.1 tRNA (adenosine(37)-N6)-dimethylallyltransferase MiaA [Bacteroidales bacterium]